MDLLNTSLEPGPWEQNNTNLDEHGEYDLASDDKQLSYRELSFLTEALKHLLAH
jgi:hypothetical protein